MLTILLIFFNEQKGQVTVEHVASCTLSTVNNTTLLKAVCELFDNKIPWTNLISVMMDSCNVIDGFKLWLRDETEK